MSQNDLPIPTGMARCGGGVSRYPVFGNRRAGQRACQEVPA